MKVTKVLSPLVKTALTRLCRRRNLPVRVTKAEILKRYGVFLSRRLVSTRA